MSDAPDFDQPAQEAPGGDDYLAPALTLPEPGETPPEPVQAPAQGILGGPQPNIAAPALPQARLLQTRPPEVQDLLQPLPSRAAVLAQLLRGAA